MLFHLTTEAEWSEAQRVGEVHPASLDTEGFVHCSSREQIPRTLEKHFRGVTDLLVLTIDPARLEAEVRWEDSAGERFPHVYGPVPVDAVVGVRPESSSPRRRSE